MNHPYFQKSNLSEVHLRKTNDFTQERNYEDLPSDNHIVNSNNMINYNKVPLNNFIEEKVKDDKMCNNKVTGLLKLKNKHI